MNEIPLTRKTAPTDLQTRIQQAVNSTLTIPGLARLATLNDVGILTELLRDPSVSGPIYNLPKPITHEGITIFIERHLAERDKGQGLLLISTDAGGRATAYYDIQVWPCWAVAELAGAIRQDRQSSGRGGVGAMTVFDWLFEFIGVNLICETGALDNARTARLLRRIGFLYKGKIESPIPGGGKRSSHYREFSREEWIQRKLNPGK